MARGHHTPNLAIRTDQPSGRDQIRGAGTGKLDHPRVNLRGQAEKAGRHRGGESEAEGEGVGRGVGEHGEEEVDGSAEAAAAGRGGDGGVPCDGVVTAREAEGDGEAAGR